MGYAVAAQGSASSNWYQQTGHSHLWVQVQLPSAVVCTQTAIIGYPSSHEPSNNAYVAGSNDGVTWTELARWDQHPGASTSYLHGEFTATFPSYAGPMATYGIDLNAGGTAYSYYRTGGDNGFTNAYQIVEHWVLMCRA